MRKTKKQNKSRIFLRRRIIIWLNRTIFVLKISALILLCLLVFTDYFKSYTNKIRNNFNNFTANYGFVLKNVIIQGRENTNYKEIINALGADKGTPIFSIDIDGVKSRLEDTPWIKTVIIERRLPSTIYIAMSEREPIAIWQFKQKLYIIDAEGNRITKYNGEGFADLIHVVGQDANVYASNLIADINVYPDLASKIRSAVRYGNRRWNLHFDQDIVVKMPEINFHKAYKYLYTLNKNNNFFNQNYKTLDLRDSQKYYIEQR